MELMDIWQLLARLWCTINEQLHALETVANQPETELAAHYSAEQTLSLADV